VEYFLSLGLKYLTKFYLSGPNQLLIWIFFNWREKNKWTPHKRTVRQFGQFSCSTSWTPASYLGDSGSKYWLGAQLSSLVMFVAFLWFFRLMPV